MADNKIMSAYRHYNALRSGKLELWQKHPDVGVFETNVTVALETDEHAEAEEKF